MSQIKLKLLNRDQVFYKGIVLLPIGDLKTARQFAIYMASFVVDIASEAPSEDLVFMRSLKDRIFSLLNSSQVRASVPIKGPGGITFISKDVCVKDKVLCVPLGPEKDLTTFADILDHVLWANTHKKGEEFYHMLTTLNIKIPILREVIKPNSNSTVPVVVEKA